MNDALIIAKQKDYDVYNALDVMEKESFLKELKFGKGDGQLFYYLYNYRLQQAIKPAELGLTRSKKYMLDMELEFSFKASE
ncbi:transferase [Lithospermum erythrorhizon]|uniref:Glycylpeptide N-tetradecanoyltransferase n=1 Tax=Lithospermum erythrorhizon TaxID=34254 RepID=A0AAV3RXK6_LITER